MKKFLLTLILSLIVFSTKASELLDTRTQIFDNSFKSLQVSVLGNQYFPPIIILNGEDYINISFDEMQEEMSYLRYSLIHCNANWQPSDLVESEYVDGFNYADIENYSFSSATISHYVNYSFTIPNKDMKILKSGNYLVQVYRQDDPDDILLQAQFYVSENSVSVGSSVTSRTDIDYNDKYQQIAIKVDTKKFNIQNPYKDLEIFVSQNGRLDNEVLITEPLSVSMNTINYEHNKKLIFNAGNEYRRVENVAEHAMNMGVDRIEYFEPYYHVTYFTDEMRANLPYRYDRTQNGRFTIRSVDAQNSKNGAEYMINHFSLNTNGPIKSGKIYIDGEFTNHQFKPEYEMKYDASTGLYALDIELKQGAYNYQYLYVPNGSNIGYTSAIEGDKYQTVNEYFIRVYNRQPSERYDRLIGYNINFSGK